MAVTRPTIIEAKELILQWYTDMRVDHLENDELLYEVSIRAIVIRDDPKFSRQRRSLREFLKAEKQSKKDFDAIIKGNKVEEMSLCEKKFQEISNLINEKDRKVWAKCKTRLLHYGHRVFQLLKQEGFFVEDINFLKSLLVDIVELLLEKFYKEHVNVDPPQSDDEEALINLFNSNQISDNPPVENAEKNNNGANNQQNSCRLSQLCSMDKAWVHSLQNRIKELESKLAVQNYQLKTAAQAPVADSNRQGTEIPQSVGSNANLNPTPLVNTTQNSASSSNPLQAGQPNSTRNEPVVPPASQPIPQMPTVSSSNLVSNRQGSSQSGSNNNLPIPAHHTPAQHSVQQPAYQPLTLPEYTPQPAFQSMQQPQTSQSYQPQIPLQPAPFSSFNSRQQPQPPQPYQPLIPQQPIPHPDFNSRQQPQPTQPYQPQVPPQFTPNPGSYPMQQPQLTQPYQPQVLPQYLPYPTLPTMQQPTNHSRHTLPVSQWKIIKYDGTDQGLKLNEFLEIIQTLSLAEHVSEVELFESAVHLFMGPALKWYMTMRTTGRLLNWQHLVLELKRTFMHPDMDALIKMKIYQRWTAVSPLQGQGQNRFLII